MGIADNPVPIHRSASEKGRVCVGAAMSSNQIDREASRRPQHVASAQFRGMAYAADRPARGKLTSPPRLLEGMSYPSVRLLWYSL